VEGGYLTRGDRWRLHYAGDKTSHRFTILDNDHFEYDIILNKEPESNRLYLAIQGWEGFDFFRQPDTIGPDILRGSYAVYKKEGVINSPAYHVGTGKLCHIHRPRIIDARGRRVWGDIWIDRGMMTMIIPEWWLADTKYPVTVDPVVGSSVVGAYDEYDYMSQDDYESYLEKKAKDPSVQLDRYKWKYGIGFETELVCNKHRVPLQLQGTYNAYAYISEITSHAQYNKPVVYPLLYSDYNDKPKYLLVYDHTKGDPLATIGDPSSFTPRWVQSTLTINGSIAANTNVWFGFWGESTYTRFDYGTLLYQADLGSNPFEDRGYFNSIFEMSQEYDFYDVSIFTNRFVEDPEYINVYPGARYDLKVSMYLAVPATYTHTVTQWVMPKETRNLTGKYQRSAKQTVQGQAITNRFEGFCRSAVQTIKNTMSLKGSPTLIRKAVEAVAALYETKARADFNRGIGDTAENSSFMDKTGAFIRSLFDMAEGGGDAGSSVGRIRVVQDTESAEDAAGSAVDYLRELFIEAGSMAETERREGFYRTQQDMALSEGVAARRLFIFLRLLVGGAIRDFVIGRFLKSKEEIVVKSPVCREIIIDSKLH
jgi:hypothetical protein